MEEAKGKEKKESKLLADLNQQINGSFPSDRRSTMSSEHSQNQDELHKILCTPEALEKHLTQFCPLMKIFCSSCGLRIQRQEKHRHCCNVEKSHDPKKVKFILHPGQDFRIRGYSDLSVETIKRAIMSKVPTLELDLLRDNIV